MFGVAFDPTINLGTVISAAGLLCVIGGAWYSLMGKFFAYHVENRERLVKIEAAIDAIPEIRDEIKSIWEFLRPSHWHREP